MLRASTLLLVLSGACATTEPSDPETSPGTLTRVRDQAFACGRAGIACTVVVPLDFMRIPLIAVIGWYNTVSMLLNTDRYPVQDGTQPELKPLS